MNCHSERSEESAHFARYAMVYTFSEMLQLLEPFAITRVSASRTARSALEP